jgi:hypothetical protein
MLRLQTRVVAALRDTGASILLGTDTATASSCRAAPPMSCAMSAGGLRRVAGVMADGRRLPRDEFVRLLGGLAVDSGGAGRR